MIEFSTTSVPHVFDLAWGSGRAGSPIPALEYGRYETHEIELKALELERMICNAKYFQERQRQKETA